jgi:hypothetical protein
MAGSDITHQPSAASDDEAPPNWLTKLERELPLLGHRNWIVVVDSAYPGQVSPGIETIYVGGGHLQVVKQVLKTVNSAKHVRGNVYLDAELEYVSDKDARGIANYRQKLDGLLKGQSIKRLPHEEIIKKLDATARTFKVLILKTDLTLPYTSVFIELDCGYWSKEAEDRLREVMSKSK